MAASQSSQGQTGDRVLIHVDTDKVHVKKLAADHYLMQVGKGRGASIP
jgi:hypothetical protein